jgi:hypothetical protein
MFNPFENREPSLSGPTSDILPVVPSNSVDLPMIALALYVQTGGVLSIITLAGNERSVAVADFSILPVAVRRVNLTGTTATGIHAMVLA